MGLKKLINFESGFQAEYLRISGFSYSSDSSSLKTELHLYKDEAARKAGKAGIQSFPVEISMTSEELDALAQEPGTMMSKVYGLVKSNPAWVDAVDCQEDLLPEVPAVESPANEEEVPPPPAEEPTTPPEEVTPPTEEPPVEPEAETPPTEGEV